MYVKSKQITKNEIFHIQAGLIVTNLQLGTAFHELTNQTVVEFFCNIEFSASACCLSANA